MDGKAWIDLLAQNGFKPTGELGKSVIEFEKRFYDAGTGMHYRVCPQLTRGAGPDTRLIAFVVSVVASLQPTSASIEAAPEVLREDLRLLVAANGEVPEERAPIFPQTCAVCEAQTVDYVPVPAPHGPSRTVVLCRSCFET